MRKKLIVLFLLVVMFVNWIENVPLYVQADEKENLYGFEIDNENYNYVWYPEDIYLVSAKVNGSSSRTIAKIFVVCGIAISKSDSTRQHLLVTTEVRPEKDNRIDSYYYDTIINSIAVAYHAGLNDIKDMVTCAPTSQTEIVAKSDSFGASASFGKESSAGISFGQTCTQYQGDVSINVSVSGYQAIKRKIEYAYKMQTGFSAWFSSSTNKKLTNTYMQTYRFDYKYTGENTIPKNQVDITASFKVGRSGGKQGQEWNGGTGSVCGPYSFSTSFYLGGY